MRRDAGISGGADGVGGGTGHHRRAARPSAWESCAEWPALLAGLDPAGLDETSALAAITELERVKRAAAATQARLAVHLDAAARQRQADRGTPVAQQGVGVGAQVALARLESPHRGGRHLGLAKALVAELPHTLASMGRGEVSEWQATLVARETACLDVEARRAIDAQIAAGLPTWGDRRTEREVRARAYAADPVAALRRRSAAEGDRHVTIRPAPDTMCYLTALLPVAQGVAAYAGLVRAADTYRATGDPARDGRGRGQLVADTLVERLTGQATAPDVPVEVELVMPADSLLGEGHAPAHLVGYGPIPATHARDLVRHTRAQVWLRRLFTSPATGQLVAMDSRRRCFEGQLRHFVILRDQFCRTPWCDAPIRHLDHPHPARDHAATSADNAQGLCEACNYTKEAPDWQTTATADRITLTTPTGTTYVSTAPDPPGSPPWGPSDSALRRPG